MLESIIGNSKSIHNWLRLGVSFLLLHSAIICLQGVRSSSGCPTNLRALDLVLSEGHLSLHHFIVCDPDSLALLRYSVWWQEVLVSWIKNRKPEAILPVLVSLWQAGNQTKYLNSLQITPLGFSWSSNYEYRC